MVPVCKDPCEIGTETSRGVVHGLDCTRRRRPSTVVERTDLGGSGSELQNFQVDVVHGLEHLRSRPGVCASEIGIGCAGSCLLFVVGR